MSSLTPRDIASTRSSMGKFMGEIITDVIGVDRIQMLFEQAGKHPDEYDGVPTGDIVLKLNVITKETKHGLLMGQAAERTARLAEDMLSGEYKLPPIAYDDKVFKFVGSANDPEKVRYAQGVWMSAQIFHDRVKDRSQHFNPDEIGDYAEGFKVAASGIYRMAADQMRSEGNIDAAEKFDAVSQSLAGEVRPERAPTMAMRLLGSMIWDEERRCRDQAAGTPVDSTPFAEKIDWLSELTVAPGSSREATTGTKPDTSLSPKQ